MKLYAQSTINEIRQRYDFRFSKSLGQNFLTDKNIIDKIIEDSYIGEDDLVIEIGPGIGVLTQAAAETGARVIAVEIDKNLIPILRETLGEYERVQVVNADILKTDINALIRQAEEAEGRSFQSVRIIGNLPYYITTPIIMKILEEGVGATSITIMMQKEVAERINAEPGTKAYGALSVAVQYYCSVKPVARVPKEVFMPQPKVDSAVIRLDLREEKPVDLVEEKVFFACIKAGFGQRRKTMSNSLTGLCGLEKPQVLEVLEELGIDPRRRAETMSIQEFAGVANLVAGKIKG